MGLHEAGRGPGRLLRSALAGVLVGALCAAGLASAQPTATNQVIRDRSLGAAGCPPAPADCVVPFDLGNREWLIDAAFGRTSTNSNGGVGKNLFHSFSFFDIENFWTAVFEPVSGATIENVFVRVTGMEISDIAGTLDTSQFSNADLFLLNPAGIVFHPTAQLDLSGSIYASTANSLGFGDGEFEFPARNEIPAGLSDMDPVSFGFLDDPTGMTGTIEVSRLGGSALAVPNGETFALVGRDILIVGNGNDFISDIEAPAGGTIAIASVASAIEVPVDIASFQAQDEAVDALGMIHIRDGASLQAGGFNVGTAPGNVVIRGGRLVLEASALQSWNQGASDGADSGVDIALAGRDVGGVIEGLTLSGTPGFPALSGISVIATGAGSAGSVRIDAPRVDVGGDMQIVTSNAGKIDIQTDRMRIGDRGQVTSDATGDRRGGDIRITASQQLEIENDGLLVSRVAVSGSSSSPSARGGDLVLSAPRVVVRDSGVVSTQIFDAGTAGDVIVTAQDELTIAGLGEVTSVVAMGADAGAQGGDLVLDVGRAEVRDSGFVSSQILDEGTAGDVNVTAQQDVTVTELGQITSAAAATASTDATAGNVTVTAASVVVTGSDGLGGIPQIAAVTEGLADSGDLTVRTQQLTLRDGGQLRTTAGPADELGPVVDTGAAGDVTITGIDEARPLDSVLISGKANTDLTTRASAGIFARANRRTTGDAGDIEVRTRSLVVENGGEVSASTIGAGRAGDVTILGANLVMDENAQRVEIRGDEDVQDPSEGDGFSAVESQGGGGGAGNVLVKADVLRITGGSKLSVSTNGAGDAGDMTVVAQVVEIRGTDGGSNRSGIISETNNQLSTSGDAGSIDMTVTERLTVSDQGRISVQSAGGGVAGDIEIRGAERVTVTDGGEITAQVANTNPDLGQTDVTSDILIEDVGRLEVSDGGRITALTAGTGDGGTITLRDVDVVQVVDGSITALSDGVGSGIGDAGSVLIGEPDAPVGKLVVTGGLISTETADDGAGGDIRVVAKREVRLQDRASVTAQSSGSADAGSIEIDAGKRFIAVNNSPLPGEAVVSSRAETASGGTIRIRASELVYLSDSRIETQVAVGGGDGGDFGTPVLLGDDASGVRPAELVVLNRSRIVASATDQGGGNILVDGIFLPSDQLRADESNASSGDSALDATSETGTPGQIVVVSPSAELAGQVVPLPSNYLDSSKLMLTPCEARRQRAGSFTIQLEAIKPPPDAPFTLASVPSADASESCENEETTP